MHLYGVTNLIKSIENKCVNCIIKVGVKMIDIYIHAKSLKISWIRRFVTNSQIESFTFHMFNSFLPQTYFFTCIWAHIILEN